jgi:outer membrane immunogenic protein
MRIATFSLAAIALAGSVSFAGAADLGAPRTPIAAAIAAPADVWTGFYVGAHLGYGWGSHRVVDDNPAVFYSLRPTGILGGLQAGYNWQINRFVLGVEADASFASISRRAAPQVAVVDQVSTQATFLGSARVRAGFAAGSALIYATGGLAIGSWNDHNFIGGVEFGNGWKHTRVGWALGAGVEYAVTRNLSVRLEYLHYDFGSYIKPPAAFWGIGSDHFRTSFDTVRVGFNYRFSTGPSAVVARY